MNLDDSILSDSITNDLCYQSIQCLHKLTQEELGFKYNNHQESIFDDIKLFPSLRQGTDNTDIVKFDETEDHLINHGTIKALIVQLTSPDVIDYNLICDFFLTYRSFITGETVMNLLLIRLIWSLQYCVSSKEENVTIGKLVLLRTFVVLRHWIINYFVDDFIGNAKLCNEFVDVLNDVVDLLDVPGSPEPTENISSFSFEKKIITNLKIHWVSAINDFLNLNIDLDLLIEANQLLQFKLPPMTDFKPNLPEEMSIHTNPSFRRSAMLSLYDKQIHKCLIYDEQTEKENPQYSINNLLLQHQSSRISLQNKLNEFKSSPKVSQGKFKENKTDTNNTTKPLGNHNYLNLKDNSWQINNKKPAAKPTVSSPDRLTTTGFSTNGNIKLPSSKVNNILPSTPVKKMDDFTINYNNKEATGSPIHTSTSNDIMNRKKSIKKFMDGFKKSKSVKFNNTHNHINSPVLDNDNKQDSPNKSPRLKQAFQVTKSTSDNSLVSENEKFTLLLNSTIQIIDDGQDNSKIGNRVDILSARIIDELEYLIRHYIKSTSPSTINETVNSKGSQRDTDGIDHDPEITGNPIVDELPHSLQNDARGVTMSTDLGSPQKKAKRTPPLSSLFPNEVSIADESIQDLSDLNIGKIDNLVNKDDRNLSDSAKRQILPNNFLSDSTSSFQRPASINWNDDVDLDNSSPSHSQEITDDHLDVSGSGMDFEDSKIINHLDAESLVSVPEPEQEPEDDLILPVQDKVGRGIIKSSTQYFDVSTELPDHRLHFNEDNQSFESGSVSTPSNLSDYDAEVADLGIALSPQSVKKQTKRISFADQRFSHNSITSGKRFSHSSMASGLKRDSVKSYLSYDSAFSVSNETSGSQALGDFETLLRKKNGYNNLRTIAGINTRKSTDLGLDLKNRSVLSIVSRSSSIRPSVRFSNLCALTELPFSSDLPDDRKGSSIRSSKQSGVADSSIFSVAIKSRKSSMKRSLDNRLSTNSSTNSVAIPGISNYVLKELAAIPDESLQSINDPVQFALSKLEGRDSKSSMRKVEDTQEPNDSNNGGDDTQAILNEINNAHTEDYGSFTQHEITQELPLTPIKKSAGNLVTSTPNFYGLEALRSPKIILDNYHMSNNLLDIEHVMQSDSHVSFVLSYNSKTIADHFTMIEKDMLQEVDWKELIELKWNKDLEPVNSWLDIIVNDKYYFLNKGVNLVIARFNLMVNWIISEILLTKHQNERIAIISRFIHVAQNCYSLQNFSSLMQIILALTSEKVQKLKETWKNLAPGDILMLKNLEELASPFKNFLNIRICINKMKPSKGCIPFVGLYLSDLIFNAERPTYIKHKSNVIKKVITSPTTLSAPTDVDSTISSINSRNELDKIVNFSKFRTAVHIVKSLSQCIEWSSNYKVVPNQELLSKCLYIKSLDEEEMNYCINKVFEC